MFCHNKKKKKRNFGEYESPEEYEAFQPDPVKWVAEENAHILEAECDKDGILQRIDHTGENTNEVISFEPAVIIGAGEKEEEKEKKEEPKYMPGERLLETIQQERPELIVYKKITTKRKNKLSKIRDKLNP